MSADTEFDCGTCAQRHPGPPLGYGLAAPAYWVPELAAGELNVLEQEICVIKDVGFFVHGLVEIPIRDSDDTFTWGVWVSLSKDNFFRATERWDTPGRESEPPYFGWLSSEIGVYPEPTLNLKTNLHTRPVGQRPLIELEPTGHPLAVEQREGITMARVREIAQSTIHPS